MKKKTTADDIGDICDEFGIDSHFVEFVWAILQNVKVGKMPLGKLPPLGNFVPQTKRECALACAVALQRAEA